MVSPGGSSYTSYFSPNTPGWWLLYHLSGMQLHHCLCPQFPIIQSKVSGPGAPSISKGFVMQHKYARACRSRLFCTMQSVLKVEPHSHLFCICHVRGQNKQTAPTVVNVFEQKKILLKLDTEPPAPLTSHIWGKWLYFKDNSHLLLI